MIHRRFIFPLLLGLAGLPSIARPAPEKPAPPAAPAVNLKKLQAGCDGGKAADCLALAWDSPNPLQTALLDKACKLNNGDACASYGLNMDRTQHCDVPTEVQALEKALRIYEAECLSGKETSCEKLLAAYEKNSGILFVLGRIQLEKRDAELTEQKCISEARHECNYAAYAFFNSVGVAFNPARAIALNDRGCQANDADLCYRLYRIYQEGDETAKNEKKAHEYFQRAILLEKEKCQSGSDQACFNLSGHYSSTETPLTHDPIAAKQYLAKAQVLRKASCKSGNFNSCASWLALTEDRSELENAEYYSCLSGILDSCKKELERLSKSLDDKEKKTVFTVEQIKSMGTRFFEINRAMRRHCRGGDLAFCLQVLDTRLPDFEHSGLSEAREKLVASLLAKHLRDACDQDDLAACEKLSEQYKLISEKAVNPDHLEKIAKLFEARCRAGNLSACVEFHARKLWQGLDADPARAEKYLEETAASARLACARGQTAACSDQLQAEFFLGAGRPELPLHPELAADAALTQFEAGKFCDGMSQSECADALFSALLELPDPSLAIKRFDRLATGLPGYMKTGCEGGNGKACLLLAAITKEPLSPDAESNPESRDAPAKNLIAYLENAWALKPDAQQARALFQRGAQQLAGNCAAGDLNACRLAAQTAGELARQDEKPPAAPPADPLPGALEFNRKGCAGGEAAACGRLGDEKMRESDEQMKPETAALLSTACSGGESRGCLHLARLAIAGRLLSAEAIAVAGNQFRIACDAKVGAGCRRLINIRVSGLLKTEGSIGDLAQLQERGCELGDLKSCENLGIRLLRGKETPARGLQLLKTNCDKNEVQSCEYLGSAYQYGSSNLAKDRVAARAYHQRACDLGSARSCESVKELEKPEPPEEPENED
jgi:TPR repeat protein